MSTSLPPHVLARHDFVSFCKFMERGFLDPPHVRLLAWHLEQVEQGKITRLIVSEPPRHGKSTPISKLFPAYFLGKHPDRQVINATHTDELSMEFGREVRDTIEDPNYQQVFPGVHCKQDSKAAGRFHVIKDGSSAKGVYKCFGRRGKAAGWGGHLILLDDLLDEGEIYSEAAKEEARRAVRKLRTRLMPGGAVVLIMSRCAEDDPVGYVLDELKHENWVVLSLPAIAEQDEVHDMHDGTVWKRKAGAALWPERYSLKDLEDLRQGMPVHEWSGKFQQRPIPMGSRLVEEEWFAERRYSDEPEDLLRSAFRITVSADTSKGTATGARTAIGVWAELERGAYLVEVQAERWQVPAILEKLREICDRVRPHQVLIEDKSTGEGIIQLLRADRAWKHPIEAVTPVQDKVVRFAACTPFMKSGEVWLPRRGHRACGWLPKFEAELFHYPATPQKDQGDMVSQFLNWRRTHALPKGGGTSWLDTLKRASGGYTDEIGVF